MADNLDTPYSRREIFYKGILDQDPDSLPDPETREERYLKAIAEAYPTPVEATVVQVEGSSTTSVMSQKAVSDALDELRDTKLDKTGTAPLADNLTPYSADSGATQSVPFNNQGTGCGNGESVVDTGSYCQLKKKLGNTVGVNQLVKNGTFSTGDTTNWSTVGTSTRTVSGGVLTMQTSAVSAIYQIVPILAGHRYILCATLSATSGASVAFGIYKNSSSWYASNITADGAKHIVIRNVDASGVAGTDTFDVRIRHNDTNSATITIEKVWLIDLTLWFGSNNAIPSHLLSHPEDWGRYYSGSLAYNPGQLVNADGTVLTSIGRNCNSGDGDVLAIPNQVYYCKGTATITYKDRGGNTISTASVTNDSFTTPVDCFSFGVSGTGVTISLYYSGESGYDEDYDYSVLAQIDTGSETLVGRNGRGDYKTPDGVVHHVMSDVNLGSLTYTKYTSGDSWIFYATIPGGRTGVGGGEILLISDIYTCSPTSQSGSQAIAGTDKNISWDSTNSQVLIKDLSISTVGDLLTALNGKTLYYELATPTTEQGTPFSGASADNFAIDDFGSMYWTQSAGVPQGVEIFYPYDYKAAVDTLLNMVDGDVEKLVTETELGAVANRIPEAPAEDGTYTLKATVADGVKTYAWVADE